MLVLNEEFPKIVKLDMKDRRILSELLHDARTPVNSVAKAVGLNPESVRYRIQRLKNRKVLMGCRTIVNPVSLGYKSYHLFISLFSPSETEKALEFVKADPRVNLVLQYLGRWDFELAIGVRTPKELYDFRAELLEVCNLQEDQTVLLMETVKSIATPTFDLPMIKTKKVVKYNGNLVDKIDRKLLKTIVRKGDLSISELAAITKLTRDQISYRIKRMKKNGVIVQYSPIINHAALGLNIMAILLKFRKHERLNEFDEWLSQNNKVFWACRSLGEYDYLIYIGTSSQIQFYDTIVDLRNRFASIIARHEILTAYREHKFSYVPESILS